LPRKEILHARIEIWPQICYEVEGSCTVFPFFRYDTSQSWRSRFQRLVSSWVLYLTCPECYASSVSSAVSADLLISRRFRSSNIRNWLLNRRYWPPSMTPNAMRRQSKSQFHWYECWKPSWN
jgi:hypothetical protein